MNSGTQNIMLKSSYQILQEELARIKQKLVTDIPQALEQAYVTGGQWHDNPHWEHMLKDQERLNTKFHEIMKFLQMPIFIEDLPVDCEKITVGTEIEARNLDTGEIEVFKIVAPLDITYNPQCNAKGFASYQSPIGRSLLNKNRNDEVVIKLPMSVKRLLILEIKRLVSKEM